MSRILIVEDEEVLADSLQDIFQGEGHQVSAVYDGRQALEALARERVDLVLLDLMLPLVDGIAILEALRRDWPTTAVIVVTASSRTALKDLAVEGYLRKPFSLEALLRKVKAALAAPAATG